MRGRFSFFLALISISGVAAPTRSAVECVRHMVIPWASQAVSGGPGYLKLVSPSSRVTSSSFLTGDEKVTWLATTVEHGDNDLRLYHAGTGKLVQSLKGVHSNSGATWSPDIVATDAKFRFLVTLGGVTNPAVHYFDGSRISHTQKLKLPKGRRDEAVNDVLVHGDFLYAVRSNGNVEVWKLSEGEFELERVVNIGITSVSALALSPDGKYFVVGGDGGAVSLFTTNSLQQDSRRYTPAGHLDMTRGGENEVTSFAFGKDGAIYCALSTTEGGRVVKLSVPGLKYYNDLKGVSNAGFTQLAGTSGKHLVSVSSELEGAVRFFELNLGRLQGQAQVEAKPSPNYGFPMTMKVFDPVQTVAVSKNGKYLVAATSGGNLSVWNIATARLIKTFSLHHGDVRTLSVSPDGKLLFVGAHMGEARVYEWDDLIH